jgi:hypothetical protein
MVTTTCQKGHKVQMKKNKNNDNTKKHAINNNLVLHPKPNIPQFFINLKFVVLLGLVVPVTF